MSQHGKTLAEETAEHAMASHGVPIWAIRVEAPQSGPGRMDNLETGAGTELRVVGMAGGWLVVEVEGEFLGIIWSEGEYYAETIIDATTSDPVASIDLDDLPPGRYLVRGAVPYPDAPLGAIF